MGIDELFIELRKLDRANKLRAMQVLAHELASEEEAILLLGTQYEIWSPFDAPGAAETLLKMLEADQQARSMVLSKS